MTVLRWDTCQLCDKPILLWSNGKWYNAMSQSQCEASTDKSTHVAITRVTNERK
jgi:hypothetical protein